MKHLFLLFAMVSPSALAEDDAKDAPEYLLGDIGVQINLDKRTWKMDRWSDWDFKATSRDSVLLYAWSTPFQMDVTESDLASWANIHVSKAKEEGSSDTKITQQRVGAVGEVTSAEVQLEMSTPQGAKLFMQGVTVPVEGKMLHLATVSAPKKSARAKATMTSVLKDIDIQKPTKAVTWGGDVSADDVSTTALGNNWRKPLKSEMPEVAKMSKALMVPNLIGCWTAIHPVAGSKPDLMITCQDKKSVGVIDTYTSDDVANDLKLAWFGKKGQAEVDAVDLGEGRLALIFATNIAGRGVHIGGIPNEAGMAKTMIVGAEGSSLNLGEELQTVLSTSSVTPPAPLEFRDAALYYISYRPFHPFVLGPVVTALVILGLILGLIVVGIRRQPAYDI